MKIFVASAILMCASLFTSSPTPVPTKADDPAPAVTCESLASQLAAVDQAIANCNADPNCSWSTQLDLVNQRIAIIAQMLELECPNVPA